MEREGGVYSSSSASLPGGNLSPRGAAPNRGETEARKRGDESPAPGVGALPSSLRPVSVGVPACPAALQPVTYFTSWCGSAAGIGAPARRSALRRGSRHQSLPPWGGPPPPASSPGVQRGALRCGAGSGRPFGGEMGWFAASSGGPGLPEKPTGAGRSPPPQGSAPASCHQGRASWVPSTGTWPQ